VARWTARDWLESDDETRLKQWDAWLHRQMASELSADGVSPTIAAYTNSSNGTRGSRVSPTIAAYTNSSNGTRGSRVSPTIAAYTNSSNGTRGSRVSPTIAGTPTPTQAPDTHTRNTHTRTHAQNQHTRRRKKHAKKCHKEQCHNRERKERKEKKEKKENCDWKQHPKIYRPAATFGSPGSPKWIASASHAGLWTNYM